MHFSVNVTAQLQINLPDKNLCALSMFNQIEITLTSLVFTVKDAEIQEAIHQYLLVNKKEIVVLKAQ